MRRLAYMGLTLSTFIMVATGDPSESSATMSAGITIRCQDEISPNRVRALTVLPCETITFEVADPNTASDYVAQPVAGRLEPLDTGRWEWTSPPEPGLYPIKIFDPKRGDEIVLQVFVVVPYERLQAEYLNGYRIGHYPDKPLHNLSDYKQPTGFVEVTHENEDILVSPHLRLRQFLCKQQSVSRKYVVLNERLLLALEYILEQMNESGYRATTFHIMSGYRTPAYNQSLGNVDFSLHQYGAAADIFIDENVDGVMDDLNGDGRSDIYDAEVLYRLIDKASTRPDAKRLIGGLGKYPNTATHGPFVHVDVRNRKARW